MTVLSLSALVVVPTAPSLYHHCTTTVSTHHSDDNSAYQHCRAVASSHVALYHHSGEALQGLHFFEGGRVLSRKTCCQGVSRMPPIVTWGLHLSTKGGLAGERGVMRWAVHVKRQTGRWFFGFVRPPLSRDYGLILDVSSDGSVSI